NLVGDGSAVTVDLSGSTPTVSGGGLGNVSLPNIGVINVTAGAGTLNLKGATGGNTFTVTGGATTTTTRTGATGPTVNVTNTGTVSVDGTSASGNQLTVVGPAVTLATYTPSSASAGTVAAGTTALTLANIQSLTYDGQAANGSLTV